MNANGSADQRLANTEGAGFGNKLFLFTSFHQIASHTLYFSCQYQIVFHQTFYIIVVSRTVIGSL